MRMCVWGEVSITCVWVGCGVVSITCVCACEVSITCVWVGCGVVSIICVCGWVWARSHVCVCVYVRGMFQTDI